MGMRRNSVKHTRTHRIHLHQLNVFEFIVNTYMHVFVHNEYSLHCVVNVVNSFIFTYTQSNFIHTKH